MALKSTIAFVASVILFVCLLLVHQRQRSTASALLVLAALCFIVVALTHVFEAHRVLTALGWGRPDTLGHYIDLAAAVSAIVFAVVGLVIIAARQRSASSHSLPNER